MPALQYRKVHKKGAERRADLTHGPWSAETITVNAGLNEASHGVILIACRFSPGVR